MTLPALPNMDELIPHRGSMNLLDRVRRFEEPTIECELVIRPDSMFVRDGKISAVVSLEYMAQSCAAYSNLVLRGKARSERIGYLVSVPRLELSCAHLHVGDELTVTATLVHKGSEVGAYDCQVHRNQQTIATASITVVAPEVKP